MARQEPTWICDCCADVFPSKEEAEAHERSMRVEFARDKLHQEWEALTSGLWKMTNDELAQAIEVLRPFGG